ncbi:MAG: 5-formyltetrahydrofolate cyclo-ligase [Candidatus Omnitrophota bacterium]
MSIDPGTELTKQQIRSKIILKLKTQKEDVRDRKSRVIEGELLKQKGFIKAKIVMFYIAFGGEVDTKNMIKEARKLGKIVTVPVCKGNRVTIRPCILDDAARLGKGPYGVCEPSTKRFVRLKDLDLVVVPGVAFDRKGNRLGRGKGCYDRFLERLPKDIPSIGLAFDFQILPNIPAKAHDISVNRVVFA